MHLNRRDRYSIIDNSPLIICHNFYTRLCSYFVDLKQAQNLQNHSVSIVSKESVELLHRHINGGAATKKRAATICGPFFAV